MQRRWPDPPSRTARAVRAGSDAPKDPRRAPAARGTKGRIVPASWRGQLTQARKAGKRLVAWVGRHPWRCAQALVAIAGYASVVLDLLDHQIGTRVLVAAALLAACACASVLAPGK